MSLRLADEPSKTLLIVHDNDQALSTLIGIFKNIYTVAGSSTHEDADVVIRQGFRPHVIVAPYRFGLIQGDSFLQSARVNCPEVTVILTVDNKEMAEIATQPLPAGVFMLLNLDRQTPETMQVIRLSFQHYRIRSQISQLQEMKDRERTVFDRVKHEVNTAREHLSRESGSLAENHIQLVAILGKILGAGHPVHHANHALFTAFIAREIALSLGLKVQDVAHLTIAALLHDIGKVGMPLSVVAPDPATLSGADRDLYQTHVAAGVDILGQTGLPRHVAQIVLQHHEKMDGSGFPNRLPASEIVPEAQILAVADAYHNRVYRIQGPIPDGDAAPPQSDEERERRIEEAFQWLRTQEGVYSPQAIHALFAVADRLTDAAYLEFASGINSLHWPDFFPENEEINVLGH